MHAAANSAPSAIQSHLGDPRGGGAIMPAFGAFLDSQKIAPGAITKNRSSENSKGSLVWAKARPAQYVIHVLSKMPTSMAAAQR